MRNNRIDAHDAPVNPGRRQQEYRFALPSQTAAKLESADITPAMRNALYRTMQLCGTYMFDARCGSVCERRHIMAHLRKHMSVETARKHLRVLERLDLANTAGGLFCFEHYSEANPTAAEARARYQARLTQLRSAQRRHRAKKRGLRDACTCQISQPLPNVRESVITQKSSQQGVPPDNVIALATAIYRSSSGHTRQLLHPRVVYQALIEAENDIFEREGQLAEGAHGIK